MSDLGRRLRQALDEVAPPADLDRIVAHEPALPFWRVGRVLAYAAALVAIVAVTVVLLTADDMDDTATESSVTTVQGTDTTLGEGEPPETDTAWTPQVLEPSYFVCSTSVEAVPCGRLFDGDPSIIWEAPDGGIGAVIEVGFDRPVEIIEVVFSPPSDEETRLRSARVSEFTVVAEGHSAIHGQMSDEPGDQRFGLDSVVTTGITISVDSAFPGVSYEGREPFLELALGEIQFLGRVAIGSPSAVPPALDTRPLSGQWFGTTPDTEGLMVLNNDLIWDGEAFYALTRLGFGDQVVWRSFDGVDWERYETIALAGELGVSGVYSGPTELLSVGGRLYAAGNANGRATVWIDDGSYPWRSVDVGPGAIRALLHHDGRFVALGDSVPLTGRPNDDPVDRHPVIWMSPDGESWGEVAGAELFGSVTWSSDLVVGPAGLLTIGFESDDRLMNRVSGVFISEDGVSWSRHDPEFLDLTQVDGIVGWDSGYAAVGLASRVLVSSDGIAWAPMGDRPAASMPGGFTYRSGLGVFNGRLLMVGAENFVPEGAEFNTTHPRAWSYTGDGGWIPIGEFEWFNQMGHLYDVVAGDGILVVNGEVGPEDWALYTFVASPDSQPLTRSECDDLNASEVISWSGLPAPVEETAVRVIELAGECDLAGLAQIAESRSEPFEYPLQHRFPTPDLLWSALQDGGMQPMGVLIEILSGPFTMTDTGNGTEYWWPAPSDSSNVPYEPWVRISEDGEWLSYVIPDRLLPDEWLDPLPPTWLGGGELEVGQPWLWEFQLSGCGWDHFGPLNDEEWFITSTEFQPGDYPDHWPVETLHHLLGDFDQVESIVTLLDAVTIQVATIDGDLVAILEPTDREVPDCGDG